jgi:hypothetical protein
MNRQDVFEVINRERDFQDSLWPRDDHEAIGQYQWAAPHMLLLEEYVEGLRTKWKNSREELDCVREIAKIAAIAVRALEEIKYPAFDLLEQGLRDTAKTAGA